MDLNSVIVSQIEKVNREESAKKEAARIQAEAAAVVRAEEEAKEEAIRLEKYEKAFVLAKKVFEESFVREIMANIIVGLNSPKNKDFLPLMEKIIQNHPRADIKNRSNFYLKEPQSFSEFHNYYINFKYGNYDIMDFCTIDGQILIKTEIRIDSYHSNPKEETLSSNKEEAAAQIISFLMTR